MIATSDKQQPEQVPGEAESPPRDEEHPAIENAVRHIDKTEPVGDGEGESGREPK